MAERIIECPLCGDLTKVEDSDMGKDMICMKCDTLFKISEDHILESSLSKPNITIDFDKFETITIVDGGYKMKLNKGKIMQFLDLFRE